MRVKKKQVADGSVARNVPTTHTQQGLLQGLL
jgi:hypothetical protein